MLSIPHIIVIFIVALVVFGPEKLPELARNIGKVMAEFRRHTNDLRSTFEGHLRDIERETETRRIAAMPAVQAPTPAPAAGPQPVPAPPKTVASDPPYTTAAASAGLGAAPEPFIPGMDSEAAAQDPYLASALEATRSPEPPTSAKPESTENPAPEEVSDGRARPA